MELLTQNTKLKNTSKEMGLRVYNFGIPAYKTKSGKLTCPMAKECVEFCYAKKGAYIWKNVYPAFEKRYKITKLFKFPTIITSEIKKKKVDFVRIHDSGDFYSREYLNKWIKVAEINPKVKFYAYTNMIKLIKTSVLPKNFDIIFSDSGKQKHLINKEIDRHTKIFHSHKELLKFKYIDTSKVDLYATKWFNKTNKVGLVIH
tara:strand:- start:11 stop:616 length:606 start_codon:yes stop_codon:yes gene_type:complete